MFCEPPQKKSVFYKEMQRVTPKKPTTNGVAGAGE